MLDRLDDFRSAQESFEELRRAGDRSGLTTVYRTLQTLVDAGGSTSCGQAAARRCTGVVPPAATTITWCAATAGERWRLKDQPWRAGQNTSPKPTGSPN
jgi:hypothetical protein